MSKIFFFSRGYCDNLMDDLLRRMEQYANNLESLVEEKTEQLSLEKRRSEELLYQVLPRLVEKYLYSHFRRAALKRKSTLIGHKKVDLISKYSRNLWPDFAKFHISRFSGSRRKICSRNRHKYDKCTKKTLIKVSHLISYVAQRRSSLKKLHICV